MNAALGAAAALLLVLGCAPAEPSVFLLGIDGATWKLIGPMLARGELPNFGRLVREGAYAPRFETMSTTSSPVVWTTVATGRAPEDHGVLEFTEQLPGGQRIPVSSRTRRVKAIWEIASERGVSVGVIGWWATWPAERITGYVVSDHANPALSEFLFADRTYWTADPDRLAGLHRDFEPAELASILEPCWLDKGSFPYAELERRGRFSADQMKRMVAEPWNRRTPYSILKTFYAIDAPLVCAARALLGERPTRLTLLYLRGPDPLQHYAWNLVEPERYPKPPPQLTRDRGIVQSVYRYLDGFIGELLDEIGSQNWLIVVSDHGAEPSYQRRPGGHTPAAKGVLFLRGPGVRPGAQLAKGGPEDLMPTLLWLLGLPLSDELVGEVLTQAFEPGFVRSRPPERVASYGERRLEPAIASPDDEALLEGLRALGYIE